MNKLSTFAYYCVNQYAHYDGCDGFYILDVSDLPDFVKHEFASLIMRLEEGYAAESTGPDNQHWDKKMLPALTRYLANSTDKDEAIEFTNVWRECVADYMNSYMQRLIDDALYDFNDDHGYIRPASYYYGVPAHGPI